MGPRAVGGDEGDEQCADPALYERILDDVGGSSCFFTLTT